MVKLSNKNVEIDAIVLNEQAITPDNPKPGYQTMYTTTSGIYTLISGSVPVGPLSVAPTTGIANTNTVVIDGSPSDNDFAKFTIAGLEGQTTTEIVAQLRTDGLIGIDDNDILEVDGTVAENDILRATAVGVEGLTYAELTPLLPKTIEIPLLDNDTALTVAENFSGFYWCVPESLNGYNITDVDFYVATVSSSGLPSFDIYNVTGTGDVLTVNCTIDATEFTSYTATTGPTINTAEDDLTTGDLIRFDCDAAGTGTKGCGVILVVEKP